MSQYAIGIDLGGTNLRVAAFRPDGQKLEHFSAPTNIRAGREAVLETITRGVGQVRAHRPSEQLLGIGIGVPGFIQLESGVITKSPNLPGLEHFPMRDELLRRLGCRVVLENDANAAALGEKWMGAGREVDDLVLLTLGTGVGGGIISGGRILHGYLGMAAELGHLTIEPHAGVACGCGNTGCLETVGSATAVARMAREAAAAGRSEALAAFGPRVTSANVYQAAMGGDAVARQIFERMGRALGLGLANLVNIFNFPLYLLAGGALAAWDLFFPALREECRQRSLTFREAPPRIEKAELGDEAGLYGAARVILT